MSTKRRKRLWAQGVGLYIDQHFEALGRTEESHVAKRGVRLAHET